MKAVWSRKMAYPVLGAGMACGLTFGLFLVQALAAARLPTLGFIREQLRSLPVVYTYTAAATTVILTVLGWLWAKREASLQARSLTDPLTGLWNRRQLANRMKEEVARALRHRTPLAFLLVDLDWFKQLNDRSGHQAGDEALKEVAGAIKRCCRRSDVAARYGGDEFAVLAPATAGADAAALGERIRSAVRDAAPGLPLSVSIGVADLSDINKPSVERQNDLCLAADRALYVAKQRGRDCVVCAREVAHVLLEQAAS